ncbi:MAG: hypothetical protein LBG72_04260 [Spirochaetaceae bacterium]|jgi:hypothetical protein|nr:hypothetical protein [Spirochaetaceae bacterium]
MKPSIFLACGAFALSFIIGLLHGSGVLVIIIRALIFAAVFFGIGMGITHIFSTMLKPDDSHFTRGDAEGGRTGSGNFGAEFNMSDEALGISGDGHSEQNVYKTDKVKDEIQIDDISGLFGAENAVPLESAAGADGLSTEKKNTDAGVLEQNTTGEYTEIGSVVNPASMNGASKVPSAINPDETVSDFESGAAQDTAQDFVPGLPVIGQADMSGGEGPKFTAGTVEMSLASPRRKSEIDFSGHDGKKMAGAIQTILNKDKE